MSGLTAAVLLAVSAAGAVLAFDDPPGEVRPAGFEQRHDVQQVDRSESIERGGQ